VRQVVDYLAVNKKLFQSTHPHGVRRKIALCLVVSI
jgi:hypothetical protein